MKEIDGEFYFTVEEVARLLGKTVRTLKRWLYEPDRRPSYAPQLTPRVFPDGHKYFSQKEIQQAYNRVLDKPMSDDALPNMLKAAESIISSAQLAPVSRQ